MLGRSEYWKGNWRIYRKEPLQISGGEIESSLIGRSHSQWNPLITNLSHEFARTHATPFSNAKGAVGGSLRPASSICNDRGLASRFARAENIVVEA